MLNRDAIVNMNDRKIVLINIPEWGGDVFIRKWSGKERSLFLSKSIKADGNGAEVNLDSLYDNMALVVAMSLCDEVGTRLFTAEQEDIAILSSKDGEIIQRIYQEALVLNGLAKKSIEDAAKNSESVPKSDSISV